MKLVLTAPDAGSTEEAFGPWKPMMCASARAQVVPRFFYKNKFGQPRNADGSAKVTTYSQVARGVKASSLRLVTDRD